jgi:hypothetical protein
MRVDIPMLMLYPNHKPKYMKSDKFVDPYTQELKSNYKRCMKIYNVGK